MLYAALKVLVGKHTGKSILLSLPRFTIGRETDCNLRSLSSFVSRYHCAFFVRETGVFVIDLGSTNGTYVNGAIIRREQQLRAGDQVSIGMLKFEVQMRNGFSR